MSVAGILRSVDLSTTAAVPICALSRSCSMTPGVLSAQQHRASWAIKSSPLLDSQCWINALQAALAACHMLGAASAAASKIVQKYCSLGLVKVSVH